MFVGFGHFARMAAGEDARIFFAVDGDGDADIALICRDADRLDGAFPASKALALRAPARFMA